MKLIRKTKTFRLDLDDKHGAVLKDLSRQYGKWPLDITSWTFGPGWETVLGLLETPMHDDDFDRMALIFYGVSYAQTLDIIPMGDVA